MKRIAIAAIVVAALGYIGNQDREQAEFERAEYCARVVAGVHTDYDHLCPANSFNTLS